MKIQVLGMGCPKCKKLYENAKKAAEELSLDVEMEKVEDLNEITKMGVMMTPALVIDGVVKAVGKLLNIEEIKKILK